MTGKWCFICGNSHFKDPHTSFHRFPSEQGKRTIWLAVFGLEESAVKPHHRVCSRHFPGGDAKKDPITTLGKRFASPKKKGPRAKRAKRREVTKQLSDLFSSPVSPTPSSSRSVTPSTTEQVEQPPLTVAVGEQLQSNYQVHELPSDSSHTQPPDRTAVLVNTSLLAHIEYLESENAHMREQSMPSVVHFRIGQIKHDDHLVRFYTGFTSYMVFLAFFNFLGPVVYKLNYWGCKEGSRLRKRCRKLNPENQLFMTLVKLRLNLKTTDLGFRFGLSTSQISRYVTTWLCFLYHHVKELDWMPLTEQVTGTLPCAFREKFPTTFAIIDGTEIFIETPTDLQMQSSTWSQYKHHNTAKFLVACTPNGAICYISPVYVGSISDVELTRICGFLTVKDMLGELGVGLNIPPFMEGRQQLPSEEVEAGRKIASLRIHVEQAIGRIKTFRILKESIPISMARLINQIVCVCAFLSNFHPALVPQPPKTLSETEVDEYFEQLTDTESDDSIESDCSFDEHN